MSTGTFRAFRSYNYRLYFSGQSLSLIGTWMQKTAVYWLIYQETHSAFMLGLAVFAAQFPSFLFSLYGGVISDRYNRFKVLLTTQVASLVQALLLTLLVFFNQYEVWHILTLSAVLGTINAFDVPARQAMVYDMVEVKEDLPNAIALNSSMVNLAKLLGPALSGIVFEELGASACFLINACSFIAVIISLLCMKIPPYLRIVREKKVFAELKEGYTYLKETPAISSVIFFLACISLLVLPFITLLPVYAAVVFKGSASTFGYLNSAIGLGAVTGTIFLASLKPGADLKKILFVNTLLFGAALIAFAYTTFFLPALAFSVLIGFGMMSQTTISNTLVQTAVSPGMRGRVISYYAMAFFGMQPVGSLLIGAISHYSGAPAALMGQGIAALLIAILFLPYLRGISLRRKRKPIELPDPSIESLS